MVMQGESKFLNDKGGLSVVIALIEGREPEMPLSMRLTSDSQLPAQ
jgi:hypothetical protein